jgi:CBS domain containing-hemolysin-like protein
MSFGSSLMLIALLIACSAFLAMAEMSVASARPIRLKLMADEGNARAAQVLRVQAQPGSYFTVVQIGQNMVAILGGVVGDGAFSPSIAAMLQPSLAEGTANTVALVCSVLITTSFFILLADLLPKRVALSEPEGMALRLVGPMAGLATLMHPAVVVFNGLANVLVRALGLPQARDERITSDDILAMTEAGAKAGVLHHEDQQVIENLFELDTRTVETAMTTRQRIVYFLKDDSEALIRARIADQPHSTYLVCDQSVDQVVGYVDAADLFARVLKSEPISLQGEVGKGLLHRVLVVPYRLSLHEMLTQFREAHEDFAVIVNEYSTVVGVITLNDVMSTVMAGLVGPVDEEEIVRRADGSWLMDGHTPIVDVARALGLELAELPDAGAYDTLAGFLMVVLRRVPKRTDTATFGGFHFEVLDVDSAKIDQVLVTSAPKSPQAPAGA